MALTKITESIQALEQLSLELKDEKSKPIAERIGSEELKQTGHLLDGMRSLKSSLEGTCVKVNSVSIKDSSLQQLRSLILMQLPGCMSTEVQSNISRIVKDALQGQCEQVLYIGLSCCPWYISSQNEKGQKASKNGLVIIYKNSLQNMLAPINSHEREQSEIFEKDWLYACEVFHFGQYLSRGKSRFVELLLSRTCDIYASEEWTSLLSFIPGNAFIRSRGFLEQCRGQSLACGKKGRNGRWKVREGATLYTFCQSLNLLFHAHNALNNNTLLTGLENLEANLPPIGLGALEKLKILYQDNGQVTKFDMLELILKWHEDINRKISKISKSEFIEMSVIQKPIEEWILNVRLGNVKLTIPTVIPVDDQKKVKHLQDIIGGKVANLSEDSIVLIARAGSFLYDLATPQSDVDYLVIYVDPIEDILGSCSRKQQSFEYRGPDKLIEYGAYEVHLFCEMLLKGSVVITELIFANDLDYTSHHWKKLIENRSHFVTENLILQYFGLIKNNIRTLEQKRYLNQPRERKLFYQIFHKASGIENMLQGNEPSVKCTGHIRDDILKIRTEPLEGTLSRENLYKRAVDTVKDLKHRLAERKKRHPENVNYQLLLSWLLSVRGIK